MRDADLREIERAAGAGDVAAMVAAARLLVRLGRPREALDWLDFAGENPQVLAEVEGILGDSAKDPLLLTRIAASGHQLARSLLEESFPDLHILRDPTQDVRGAAQRLLRGSPVLQLAALHTAFERLATSEFGVDQVWELAVKLLRRKRTWEQSDFVGLLQWLTRVAFPQAVPWSAVLTQVQKSVPAGSMSEPLLRSLIAVERHFARQGIQYGQTLRLLKRVRALRAELGKRPEDPW